MGNIEAEPEEKKDPITDPCPNLRAKIHQRVNSRTEVFIVEPSGNTKCIGLVGVCMATYEADNRKHECLYVSAIPRKFKHWPHDLSQETWEAVAKDGPSYWRRWGVHVCRTANGAWHNFNELNCVPPFKDLGQLEPKDRKALEFRARFDSGFPTELHQLFGGYEPGADVVAEAAKQDELEALPF